MSNRIPLTIADIEKDYLNLLKLIHHWTALWSAITLKPLTGEVHNISHLIIAAPVKGLEISCSRQTVSPWRENISVVRFYRWRGWKECLSLSTWVVKTGTCGVLSTVLQNADRGFDRLVSDHIVHHSLLHTGLRTCSSVSMAKMTPLHCRKSWRKAHDQQSCSREHGRRWCGLKNLDFMGMDWWMAVVCLWKRWW